jgi:hypothetical protein
MHTYGLHNLYCTAEIITASKLKRVGWPGHVTRMGEMRYSHTVLAGKPEGSRRVGLPRKFVDRTIILKLVSKI